MIGYPIHLGCGGPLLLRSQVPGLDQREPLCCGRCHAGVWGEPGQVAQANAACAAEIPFALVPESAHKPPPPPELR